jgi:hypothetical protein
MSQTKLLSRIQSELGLSKSDIKDLWKMAKRRDPGASLKLLSLVEKYPKLEGLLKSFADERKKRILKATGGFPNPVPESKPESDWERMTSKSGSWVSVVGGGLPSLGKRK